MEFLTTPTPFGVIGADVGYLFDPSPDLFNHRDCIGFGNAAFAVGLLSKERADAIIRDNHYSGRITNGSTLHLGLWIGGVLVGVLQYGNAMNPASAPSVVTGTLMSEYLELNRMWLSEVAPRNSESKALAYSVRLIRRVRPAVKWIQSFADERCGLFGTVYQAAGFTFHGEHIGLFWELDGDWYHNSLMTAGGKRALAPRASHLIANRDRATLHRLRQFRYLKFLQVRFARGCQHPVRPFPKPDYAAGIKEVAL